MSDTNFKLIAKEHLDDPLNTWPQHNNLHRLTLLGNPLFDGLCLRCWLEQLASEKVMARKLEEDHAQPDPKE